MEAQQEQVAGFLQERLAAAKAIPLERRTPDVSAFIETCRLQQEVAEALELPAVPTTTVESSGSEVFSLYVDEGITSPLAWSPRLHSYAHDQLVALSMRGKLFHAGTSLDTVAKATAALLSTVSEKSREEMLGTLTTANAAVAQLQQPAMRRRLKRELAAVQRQVGWQLLSYEQLLALFVKYAGDVSETLVMKLSRTVEAAQRLAASPATTKRAMQAGVLKAFEATTELLSRLEPDRPRFLMYAASALNGVALFTDDKRGPANGRRVELLERALRLAEQQGSDFFAAACGYSLVTTAVFEDDTQQAFRPSVVLGWLQRAGAAHRRCKGVLPSAWTLPLMRHEFLGVEPWLLELQQQGDRWHPRSLASMQGNFAAGYLNPNGVGNVCTGCGRVMVQLRTCGGCKEAKYCR